MPTSSTVGNLSTCGLAVITQGLFGPPPEPRVIRVIGVSQPLGDQLHRWEKIQSQLYPAHIGFCSLQAPKRRFVFLYAMAASLGSDSIITRWTEGLSGTDQTDWVKLHSQNITYTDHAFQLRRTGQAGIASHIKTWRESIPDFKIEADASWVEKSLPRGRTQLVFKTNNTGTFINDLPSLKASGKAFWFPGIVELIVCDEDGLIESVNEYYTARFDRIKSVDEYMHPV
ncbi:hypothetical protein ACJZ2D_000368 [Fusarium nematophilum]